MENYYLMFSDYSKQFTSLGHNEVGLLPSELSSCLSFSLHWYISRLGTLSVFRNSACMVRMPSCFAQSNVNALAMASISLTLHALMLFISENLVCEAKDIITSNSNKVAFLGPALFPGTRPFCFSYICQIVWFCRFIYRSVCNLSCGLIITHF